MNPLLPLLHYLISSIIDKWAPNAFAGSQPNAAGNALGAELIVEALPKLPPRHEALRID